MKKKIVTLSFLILILIVCFPVQGAWKRIAQKISDSGIELYVNSTLGVLEASAPILVNGSSSIIGSGTSNIDIDANGQSITLGDASINYVSIADSGKVTFSGTAHIVDIPVKSSDGVKLNTLSTDTNGNFTISGTSLGNVYLKRDAVSTVALNFGSSTVSSYFTFKNDPTYAQFLMGARSDGGRQLIFTDQTNIGKDHDHATPTDPTFFIHSATNPDTDNTQYVAISHDKTNSIITSGKGAVQISPYMQLLPIATPAQPTAGAIVYIDEADNDVYVKYSDNDTVKIGDKL
jgi:hypothetical protein